MLKNKKGFSLVELIVIIAILAVFAAILAPSLLQYTENSRAQKDESTMDEVVNAVQLALADEKCFDEALKYSCTNNYITYSDSSGNYGQQINDGEFWAPDGSGRATTITFNPEYGPNNQIIYDLSKALINDMTYGNGSDANDRIMEGALIADNQCYFNKLVHVYNSVRQVVGTDVVTTSQTYRNSSFTIFIKFNQKDGATIADVSGSFNGTNLYEGANAANGSGTSEYDNEGNAITTVTTPGSSKSEYTSSSLSGTGSFGGSTNVNNKIEDYKQPTYIENIQKENKCYYYSTLKLAVDDVNNNTIGQNGDSDKDNAVAFTYTENGITYVVLLKDHTTTASIETTKTMTIVLGGNELSGTDMKIISNTSKETLTIDARIDGSMIRATSIDNSRNAICVYNNGHIIVRGGTYHVNCHSEQTGGCGIANNKDSLSSDIQNITVTADGVARVIYGIQIKRNSIIDNCSITITNDKEPADFSATTTQLTTAGIYSLTGGANNSIKNTTITTTAGSGRYVSADGADYWTGAMGVFAQKETSITIDNCYFTSSSVCLQAQGTLLDVYNTKCRGGRAPVVCINDAVVYLESCELIEDSSLLTKDTASVADGPLLIQESCVFSHDCYFVSGKSKRVYVENNSTLKISQTTFDNVSSFSIKNGSIVYLGVRSVVPALAPNGTTIISTSETYKK